MLNSLLIVCSFVTIIPVSRKISPDWTPQNLRFFAVMLPVCGILIFAPVWAGLFLILHECTRLSINLRGLLMTLAALALTGGLHMDGLMDTSDAVFSHRDRETRLNILSDSHSGSFAVIACVSALMLRTLLFAELLARSDITIALTPVYSRLGMAVLLNNVRFAKAGGLAASLGASRDSHDNYILAIMFACLAVLDVSCAVTLVLSLALWYRVCVKIFGGITGDLLGAFVEISEIVLLFVCVAL